MASIKIKFRSSPDERTEGKIYFQIIHKRTVRLWFSVYKVFNDEWDSKNSTVIMARPERKTYLISVQERIKLDIERFKRIIAQLTTSTIDFTAEEIIEEFSARQREQSFFSFMESMIFRLKELGKQRTSETYISALNSLRSYKENEEVYLDGFDSDLMEAYQAYLKNKGLIPNSISFHMRILRAVYNRAIEKGLTEDRKPFRHVYTGVDKTIKRAIDVKTLRKLREVDLKMNPAADYARDIFLLSFFLRGMSFVDMAYLKKTDLSYGLLKYRRRKTGQQLTVKWTAKMQNILDKYPPNNTEFLLPIITNSTATPYNQYRSKQYKVNKALKIVADRIGLNMSLTLYCSRHSWASIAKAKGIPMGVISDGLGHDNEHTTQIYLSTLDTSAVDEANALIMNLI